MKASNKIDGVVDAARFDPDGRLACVRVYQRLGATFSDHVVMDRAQLVALLKKGKRFGFGQRKESWGFSFEPSSEIKLVTENGQDVLRTTPGSGAGDDLKGIPFF